ncbi:hypothetical protein [Arthrobacter sp. NPDC090010]|uniref:hypothetical protein n=1 Tax=Arthrobacter sp. NPDC090010 TaxID=3363942 RepID=UPI0037FB2222
MDYSVSQFSGRQAMLQPGMPFSTAELNAMVLDGLLRVVARDAYVPCTAVVDARARARALAERIPLAFRQRIVVGRLSAAWIHGHPAEPLRPVLLVDQRHRVSGLRRKVRADYYEGRLGPHDVVSLGGLLVTTPLRTAVDVATALRPELAVPTLRSLIDSPDAGISWRILRLAVEHTVPVQRLSAALEKVDACLH